MSWNDKVFNREENEHIESECDKGRRMVESTIKKDQDILNDPMIEKIEDNEELRSNEKTIVENNKNHDRNGIGSQETLSTSIFQCLTTDSQNRINKKEDEIVIGKDERIWLFKRSNSKENLRDWHFHRKHILILTETGKPVFSRHGDEIQLNWITGIFAALFGVFSKVFIDKKSQTDDLLKIITRGQGQSNQVTIVFLKRGPLILVNISQYSNHRPSILIDELDRIHLQIVSSMTLSFERTLNERPNFDLRSLFSSSDIRILRTLATRHQRDINISLRGIEPLPLLPKFRYLANCSIRAVNATDPILASAIFAGSRLVALSVSSYLPATQISSEDLSCVSCLLMSLTSPRDVESWMPVCLPRFNSQSFINIYVNYVADPICVVFFSASTTSEQFHSISLYCNTKCKPILKNSGCIDAILKSLECCPYTLPSHISRSTSLIHLAYSIRRVELMPETLKQTTIDERPVPLVQVVQGAGNQLSPQGTKEPHGTVSPINITNSMETTTAVLQPSSGPLFTDSHEIRRSSANSSTLSHRRHPPLYRTQLRQVFSSALMDPLAGYRIENQRKSKRISRLYQLALSLAQGSPESFPIQILLETKHERVFCIMSQSIQVCCCTPIWSDLPKDNFLTIFQWLQQQEQYIFTPVSLLTYFN